MKKVRSSQASISINSCNELSKTQFFPVSIVNSRVSVLRLSFLLPSDEGEFKICLPITPPRPMWLFYYKRKPLT